MRNLFNPTLIPLVLWHHRNIIYQWTSRILKSRYSGSFLGPLWNLATPLLMLAIYTFVFGVIFHARWQMLAPHLQTTKSYAVILFCGLAVFNVFSETITGCLRCILDNVNLVKKVIFPLEVLPAAQLLSGAFTSIFWFLLVLIAALFAEIPLTLYILLFPLSFIPLLALSLGIGWFVAATSVYLRDFPHFAALFLQALFYMTPIFYPESMVPQSLLWLLNLNPLTWICRQTRDFLLFAQMPSWIELLATWAICLLICQAGFTWFKKVQKGFADVL